MHAAAQDLINREGEEGHAFRIQLATKYLQVVKRLAYTISDGTVKSRVRGDFQLYHDIHEFVEGTDGEDVEPTLPPYITDWAHLMDPAPNDEDPAANRDHDEHFKRNNAARFHAFQAMANRATYGEDGVAPYAPHPCGPARYHFLALADVVRILYPPGASTVAGWAAGSRAARKPARGRKRGRGEGGAEEDVEDGGAAQQAGGAGAPPKAKQPPKPRMCARCKVPLKGHKAVCPYKKQRGPGEPQAGPGGPDAVEEDAE